MAFFKSIHGLELGLDGYGRLVSNGIPITRKAVDVTITVGAETTNVRAITIQLKDANGVALNEVQIVKLYVFSDATQTAMATGGSTGIAAGASGTILRTITAKKLFEIASTSAGLIAMTWTDTGTESVVLGLMLANGRVILSSAFANT